ncbi:NAD(P)/FAD-dependent oxidoreductase [Dongia soli]|uniref:FAD-binding oxidoreductase n=1 Tax=Dongia soli TaxID=600628 RepID=A0ABU5EF46_9PROT|nr:FAD-binding oxidoreductase [Dongia soli]MDY0885025.1 FAD-binding oxidoreductase [Dongia soli]
MIGGRNEIKADVLVIGGGIAGCATALHLAKRGKSVILLERDQPGIRASGVNFGGVRQHGRAVAEIPLSRRARQIWGNLSTLIGIDGDFIQTGHLRLARKPEDIEILEAHRAAAGELGLAIDFLDRATLKQSHPWIGDTVIAATFCAEDGHANPRLVAPAFAAAAQAAGAELHEFAEVAEAWYANSLFHLRINDGRHFAAAVLVNAAGAWASTIAGWFDEPVALRPEVPQVLVTEPAPYRIKPVLGVIGGDLYLRQTLRGNILFGGGEGRANEGFTRSRPLPEVTRQASAMAIRLVPMIAHLPVIRSWTGVDGYTTDGSPIVGPSETHPGLFHAFGFCGHGFQLGPAVGAVLSELIADGRSDTSIAGLSIGRFRAKPETAVENSVTEPAPINDAGSD